MKFAQVLRCCREMRKLAENLVSVSVYSGGLKGGYYFLIKKILPNMNGIQKTGKNIFPRTFQGHFFHINVFYYCYYYIV